VFLFFLCLLATSYGEYRCIDVYSEKNKTDTVVKKHKKYTNRKKHTQITHKNHAKLTKKYIIDNFATLGDVFRTVLGQTSRQAFIFIFIHHFW